MERSSEETVHVAHFHHHSLQLGVILHCHLTVLSSKAWQNGGTNFVSVQSYDLFFRKPVACKATHHTWVLIPSERDFNRADVIVVDVAGPSLQVRSHAVGSRNIPADINSGLFSSGQCSTSTYHTKAVWYVQDLQVPIFNLAQLITVIFKAQHKCQTRECAINLVKTPEASPKVVLLALWITSSSVSKAITDMTGPKISSFTQVISSLQLSVTAERSRSHTSVQEKNTDWWQRCFYQEHTGTWSNLLSVWGHWGPKALLHKAQWLPGNTSDWLMLDLKKGKHMPRSLM